MNSSNFAEEIVRYKDIGIIFFLRSEFQFLLPMIIRYNLQDVRGFTGRKMTLLSLKIFTLSSQYDSERSSPQYETNSAYTSACEGQTKLFLNGTPYIFSNIHMRPK